MYSRVAQRSTPRIVIALTIGIALLPLSGVSLLTSGAAQGRQEERKPKPRPGKPEGVWPDLEDIKQESHIRREAPPPVPSSIRSLRNSGKPWDGRRVGDPEATGNAYSGLAANTKRSTARRSNQTRRAHARARMSPPPPVPHDQFVQNFFTYALTRSPYTEETNHWYDQLRAAYANGATSLKLAAIELGRTLFESVEYADRGRNANQYVYDLYKTYLMREPDAGGWAYWEALLPTHGREYVRRGFEESAEFATLSANITTTGTPSSTALSLISAQVDPRNQPGRGMLTRDANWSVPLLSLPGRAGLDLGLVLSYSSQVWTRSGPYIYFDEDNGFPSPGFRLGFPTVQRKVFDAQTAKNAYLMITAGGRRVELKHVNSNIYDAADSSYLRLTDNGGTLLVHSTDGTKLSFTEINGEWRCTEVKDRNGNYITVNYNSLGRITTIIDTLGRLITFNYDGNANLLSITQSWAAQPSHQWVGFGWGARPIQPGFSASSLRGVVAPTSGTMLPVITQVTLNDTSRFTFDYTNSLQVSEIKNYFDTIERNATTFIYETPAGDAPRLKESRLSARNWSGYNNVPAQVVTSYSVDLDGACVLTAPDGTIYKEYYGTGWQKGLTTLTEVWSGGVKQKWTTTAWTQDDTGISYELNPRVTETNVYDTSGNRRRTVIDYGPYAQWGLPYGVREFGSDGVTEIRQTYTDYNLNPEYLERRIIGLVSYVHVSNVAQWQSKTSFTYDDPARLQSLPAAATQHDGSYNTSFTARGNVTSVSRWDVNDSNNVAKKLTSFTNYYTTGTPSSTIDPAGHQNTIAYADAFSDNVTRNTFAYPTTITDADNHSSYVQYNFDFGATMRTEGPPPEGESQGAIQTMTYNNLGQVERITTSNNGAYKRFWYGAEFTASYATVNNVADELYTVEVTDGLGRVIGALSNHPGSEGGYRLVNTVYNLMGRPWLQSNPTEVNSAWEPRGDDSNGIYYTQQTYDWQGRPLVTTNQDGTTKTASYAGCGCAGGEVVTLTDEVGRQQKIYSDVLGRTWKTEILNWDSSIYSARVTLYNARDQVTTVNSYKGAAISDLSCPSGTCMQSVSSYDGYGRLATHKLPQQTTAASYVYNADGTVQSVTDPRGVVATNSFNGRHLLTGVSYTPAGGVPALASVSFGYDAAGNRTSMSDGTGSAVYEYDQLSRMASETRTFSGLAGSYTINYDYNVSGLLTSVTDPSGTQVNYVYDTTGRLSSMPAFGYSGVTNFLSNTQYRATGALKKATYGNGAQLELTYNSRMQIGQYQVSSGNFTAGATMAYYADGRANTAFDLNDSRFDRKYEFDFSARLKEAYSGVEAHGAPPPPLVQANSPYRQTYSYDEWNNVTLRTGRIWSAQNEYAAASYSSDNKRAGTSYDAAGNVTWTINEGTRTYDAAGRPVSFTSTQNWQVYPDWPTSHADGPALETQETFDGTGRVVKHVHHARHDDTYDIGGGNLVYIMSDTTTTIYYLHSSVLGKTIAHLDQSGNKILGYVYAGDTRVATQTVSGGSNSVQLESTNPVTGATVLTAANGNYLTREEPDPLGRDLINPPDPMIISDPLSTSKWNEPMPIEYAPHWTGELERGMAQHLDTMDMVRAREAYKRWLKSERTSNPDRRIWEEILYGNPNVGIVKGKQTLWGKDAADFLIKNSDFITLGEDGIIFRPQSPVPLPSDLKDRIADRVNNPATKCGELIKNVIGEAARRGAAAYSDDPLIIFDRVQNEGGFHLRIQKNAGEAPVTMRGKRIVYIQQVNGPEDQRIINHIQNAYAMNALNEIMHHAASGGSSYSNRALARALFNVLTPVEQAKNPLPKSSNDTVNGRYFHNFLTGRCPPSERK